MSRACARACSCALVAVVAVGCDSTRHRIGSAGRRARRAEVARVRELRREHALPGRPALLRPHVPAHRALDGRRLLRRAGALPREGRPRGRDRRVRQALGHYDAEKIALPPDVDCAYGATLAAASAKKEHAELGARVLHRCVLAVPVGSPLREHALGELATLADAGLDPLLLGAHQARRPLPDARAPRSRRPTSSRSRVAREPADQHEDVRADSRASSRDAELQPALVACWEALQHRDQEGRARGHAGDQGRRSTSREYEDEAGPVRRDQGRAAVRMPAGPRGRRRGVRPPGRRAGRSRASGSATRSATKAHDHDQVGRACGAGRGSYERRGPQPDLRAMTLGDAEAFAVAQGWPRFRGEQVWRWVHDKGARSFDEMTNLARDARARARRARAMIGSLEVAEVQTSHDGTRKLRLVTRDGQSIESVLIPDGDKTTQCISSQVGCAVDCQFCATAKLGLKRNLDAGEIVDQVYLARRLLAEVEPGAGSRTSSTWAWASRSTTTTTWSRRCASSPHDKGAGLVAAADHGVDVGPRAQARAARQRGRPAEPRGLAQRAERRDPRRDHADQPQVEHRQAARRAAGVSARAAPPDHVRVRAARRRQRLARRRRPAREAAARHQVQGQHHPVQPAPRGAVRAARRPRSIDAFQSECKRLGLPTYLRTPRGDDIDAACGQLANRTGGAPIVPLRVRKGPPPAPAVD